MGKRVYTDEQKAFLMNHIPGHTYQETIDAFERRFGRRLTPQILNGCCGHWNIRTGTCRYFPKGHVPANKGRKVPRECQSVATQFKPGCMIRARPVGSERLESDGHIYVKTANPRTWQKKSRYVWEQHHGKIPAWHSILFRDGDRYNFDISNLVCVSRAEQTQLIKMGVEWHDPETFDSLLLIAKVKNEAIHKRGKEVPD